MDARIWRFRSLVPSPRAFPDCTLPGHVRTLYSALGTGAADEQLEGTAVEDAENYFIDFVKAGPNNGAALHSHGSEETFVALTGRWEVFWGRRRRGERDSRTPSTASSCPVACCAGFATSGKRNRCCSPCWGHATPAHVSGARTCVNDSRGRASAARRRALPERPSPEISCSSTTVACSTAAPPATPCEVSTLPNAMRIVDYVVSTGHVPTLASDHQSYAWSGSTGCASSAQVT